MKILMISLDFLPNPGGVAIFLHNLCLQLCRLGHHVDVLTPFKKDYLKVDAQQPYHTHRYGIPKRLSSIFALWQTFVLFSFNRYDVIFIGHFMITHALGALILRKVLGVPYVILSHGNDLHYSATTKVDKWVARLLLDNSPLMLGNSRFTVGAIRQAGYRGPVEVLNPGVDSDRFHLGVDTSAVREKYGLDGQRLLLTVARLVARKNIDGVLRALPRVIEQMPDVLYLVVGDGEERKRLETLSEELGLSLHVHFLGHVQDEILPPLYYASELFVLPSCERENGRDYEGFGIVFVEANACGKPVIAGRGGGTADAVIDGETGLLVDPHNADEIAGAIIRLLANRDVARIMGENGRRRVEQELTWYKVAERLEKYLCQIVHCGPSRR